MPAGIIKGALARMGYQATVTPEITQLPACECSSLYYIPSSELSTNSQYRYLPSENATRIIAIDLEFFFYSTTLQCTTYSSTLRARVYPQRMIQSRDGPFLPQQLHDCHNSQTRLYRKCVIKMSLRIGKASRLQKAMPHLLARQRMSEHRHIPFLFCPGRV